MKKHGVHTLFFDQDAYNHMNRFLVAFREYRNEAPELVQDVKILEDLPFSGKGELWRAREKDYALCKKLIEPESNILEVGSWNNWLTHRLAIDRHNVVATDYFVAEFDGLYTKRHYAQNNWTAIQMELDQLDVFQKKFDFIVVNRSLPYFADLKKTIDQLKNLLTDKGQILVTGINIHRDASKIEAYYHNHKRLFEEQYGIPFGFKKTLNFYLKPADLSSLKKAGFSIKTDLKRGIKNALYTFSPSKSRSYYGVYKKT